LNNGDAHAEIRLHSIVMPREWSLADTLHETYRHITGAPVEYDVRPYDDAVRTIDAIGATASTENELRAAARSLRQRARDGEPLDALMPEVLAVAREIAARVLGMRPFDVQMAAAVAMHRRKLVQLATGEGKTLVAALAALVRALDGRGVHVFTANDYLARRDAEWMAPLYRAFELEPAFVIEGLSRDARRRAYACDVTYVTAK
jgi:preprotein translocase subunit SecA